MISFFNAFGLNIALYNRHERVLSETSGQIPGAGRESGGSKAPPYQRANHVTFVLLSIPFRSVRPPETALRRRSTALARQGCCP